MGRIKLLCDKLRSAYYIAEYINLLPITKCDINGIHIESSDGNISSIKSMVYTWVWYRNTGFYIPNESVYDIYCVYGVEQHSIVSGTDKPYDKEYTISCFTNLVNDIEQACGLNIITLCEDE